MAADSTKTDRLGVELAIDDWVAYTDTYVHMHIGKIVKITPKMVAIVRGNSKVHKYPVDCIKVSEDDVLLAKLKGIL